MQGRISPDLTTCLDLPLGASLKDCVVYNPETERIKKRAESQKRELSKGGNGTLIKSTTPSIPTTYYMYLMSLPISAVKRSEQTQRNPEVTSGQVSVEGVGEHMRKLAQTQSCCQI